MSVFGVYYVMVCQYFSHMLSNVLKSLDVPAVDHGRILKSYLMIRQLVASADEKLSLPIFIFCLFNASITFLAAVDCISLSVNDETFRLVSMWVILTLQPLGFQIATLNKIVTLP
ncbi:hypothetical protein AVEN_186537-1 [Araneus ventricosus]|uniref:Uncharacterized protein n=1 Tax=Araneus ventricosus TaxID=182803 RepID=A0A4Y2J7X9_ARAVE|nr:hypothetical protein AVEN_186537-1 [Araneus ventricosus]